jgi:hypothetical protein
MTFFYYLWLGCVFAALGLLSAQKKAAPKGAALLSLEGSLTYGCQKVTLYSVWEPS